MSHKDVQVDVRVREWRQYDIDYWSSYGVPLEWLKYAEVYPISHKIVTKNGVKHTFGADKLAYAFVEHKEGKVTLKNMITGEQTLVTPDQLIAVIDSAN